MSDLLKQLLVSVLANTNITQVSILYTYGINMYKMETESKICHIFDH